LTSPDEHTRGSRDRSGPIHWDSETATVPDTVSADTVSEIPFSILTPFPWRAAQKGDESLRFRPVVGPLVEWKAVKKIKHDRVGDSSPLRAPRSTHHVFSLVRWIDRSTRARRSAS
jgi:hypothetical protein